MTHIVLRSATVKHAVVPACSSWPSAMSFSNDCRDGGGAPLADSVDLRILNAKGSHVLDCGLDVGVGGREVGLGLLPFGSRQRVVLEQRGIALGNPFRVPV
jgi:6-phosphogluconate dehydrogenase (decarboxylating)